MENDPQEVSGALPHGARCWGDPVLPAVKLGWLTMTPARPRAALSNLRGTRGNRRHRGPRSAEHETCLHAVAWAHGGCPARSPADAIQGLPGVLRCPPGRRQPPPSPSLREG